MRNIFKRSVPNPEENLLATKEQLMEISAEVERLTPVMSDSITYPGSPNIVDRYSNIFQISRGVIRLFRTNTSIGSLEDPNVMHNWHISTDETPTEKIGSFLIGRQVIVDVDLFVSSRATWEREEFLKEMNAKGKRLGFKEPPRSSLHDQLGRQHIAMHDVPFGTSRIAEQVYDAETGQFARGANSKLWQDLATAKELRLNDIAIDVADKLMRIHSEALEAERPSLRALTSDLANLVLSDLRTADVNDRLEEHPWATPRQG